MHLLSPNTSDKKLIFTFIIFSLTFFVVAMIALFIVIYASDANEIFQKNRQPSISFIKSDRELLPINLIKPNREFSPKKEVVWAACNLQLVKKA